MVKTMIIILIAIYIVSMPIYCDLIKVYRRDVDIEYKISLINLIIMMLPMINTIYCLVLYLQIKENNEL